MLALRYSNSAMDAPSLFKLDTGSSGCIFKPRLLLSPVVQATKTTQKRFKTI